jgi:hypothetical protein
MSAHPSGDATRAKRTVDDYAVRTRLRRTESTRDPRPGYSPNASIDDAARGRISPTR